MVPAVAPALVHTSVPSLHSCSSSRIEPLCDPVNVPPASDFLQVTMTLLVVSSLAALLPARKLLGSAPTNSGSAADAEDTPIAVIAKAASRPTPTSRTLFIPPTPFGLIPAR